MIENFDSSDGMTRSIKNTPLSQKLIVWGFHWNRHQFYFICLKFYNCAQITRLKFELLMEFASLWEEIYQKHLVS